MPTADMRSNFGGIDPRATRPAWMEAPPDWTPPTWQERLQLWLWSVLAQIAARLASGDSSLGALQGRSWMASEAMALGSADLFELADDYVRPREDLRFRGR